MLIFALYLSLSLSADSIFFFNSFVSVVLHLIVLVMVVALYRYNKRLHVYLAYKVDLRQRCQVCFFPSVCLPFNDEF